MTYERKLEEQFDWSALKRDCMQNAVTTLHECTLDELWSFDLTDGEAIIGQAFLGTVFALVPSGKYYMPWACSNVAPCLECGGEGEVNNPLPNLLYYERYKKESQDLRANVVESHGAWCNGNWPTYVVEHLDELRRVIDNCAPTLTCEKCGGLGSAEAYQDQLWYEALESVCDDHDMWYTASEGNAADIVIERWVSFAEIVRCVLDQYVAIVQNWLDGKATIRDVKEELRVAKSLVNKIDQIEKGGE